MRRKFLSVVLCVCMMLTMAPFAFAAGEAEGSETEIGTTNPPSSSSGSGSGSVTAGITTEDALKEAISNAATAENKIVTLDGDIDLTSQLTINTSITLNGNGHKITASGQDTNWPNTPTAKHLVLVESNNVTINNITFDCANLAYDVHVYTANGVTFNNVTIQNSKLAALGVNASSVTATGNFTTECSTWQNSVNICWGTGITGVNTCSFDASNATLTGVRSVYADTDDVSHATSTSNFTFTPPSNGTWNNIVSDSTAIKYVNYDNAVAQVGNTPYDTLAAAVAAIKNSNQAGTIGLLRNVSERLWIRNNEDVTLNLNGYTLSSEYQTANVQHGKLTVNGPGTIKEDEPYFGALLIKGSTSQSDTNYAVATINKDVTLEGWAPLFIDQNSGKAYGVTVNLDGAILNGKRDSSGDLGAGIYVNGSIKDPTNAPAINLKSTTVNSEGQGMYLAGYTTTTVDKDSSVIGSQTGIEIRAGKLDVSGATITGNGDFSCTPDGNGSTTNGVGIAIAQHTTKLPIDVTISGGTISGKYAVYESNPQNNDSTSIGQVKLSITDGNFNGSTAAVYSQDVKDFISGGLFTTDPSDYCVANKAGIPSNNRNYPFTIGEINAAVKVAEGKSDAKNAPDNSTFDNSITQDTVKQVASSATASLSGASGDVAQNIDESTVNKAKSDLGTLATEGKTVVVLVQPYLEITPTGSSSGDSTKSISLNIEPKYNLIATTNDVVVSNPDNVKTDGADKNAVVMDPAKPLTVTTPTPVTLTLPDGFAQANASVYIKHEASNGKIYYYTAIVGEDHKITFTTKNGFSPFTISTTSEAVAEVDGIGYATFQDAVDAVENGGTIKALKNIDSTVSGNKTFAVNANSNTVTLTAASGYNLTSTPGSTDDITTYTVSRPSSGSPGSSGGSTPTTYAVNVNAATNGAVAADKKTASKGTTVTVTASPSKGYVVDAVKVVDKDGKDVAVTEKDGKYVFTMPASAVTVTGSFKAETPTPVALPFTDVKSGNWFYDAVKYAYAQGLMTGTSATTFTPNGTMNRAMIVTVLYRLEKSPAVTGASKFTDVPAGQWYSDAVAWAAANKIVNGYDETTFGPMNAVTREQMAAILFRYEQYKGLENVTLEENLNRFPDQNKISAYAIPALQWAVGQKIINGNADGTLDPTGTATRAQVAQIFTNLLNQ